MQSLRSRSGCVAAALNKLIGVTNIICVVYTILEQK